MELNEITLEKVIMNFGTNAKTMIIKTNLCNVDSGCQCFKAFLQP